MLPSLGNFQNRQRPVDRKLMSGWLPEDYGGRSGVGGNFRRGQGLTAWSVQGFLFVVVPTLWELDTVGMWPSTPSVYLVPMGGLLPSLYKGLLPWKGRELQTKRGSNSRVSRILPAISLQAQACGLGVGWGGMGSSDLRGSACHRVCA